MPPSNKEKASILAGSNMNVCRLIYFKKRMEEDDYRTESEVEPDSDHDDQEEESQLSRWLANTNNFSTVSFLLLFYTSIILRSITYM
ncbi:hypothetical protein SNE40_022811 [Patella caerulea]|uniref:Uncharacterized protein n=1 Tax=Patella caerulea TaxID=87958 RepID=A0AAN8G1A8_PATCE